MENYFYHYTNEEQTKAIKVKLCMENGGYNYFNGQTTSKGIFIHFTEVEIEKRDGYSMESFTAFAQGNFKILVKELTRKNQKEMDNKSIKLQEHKEKIIEAYYKKDIETIKLLLY